MCLASNSAAMAGLSDGFWQGRRSPQAKPDTTPLTRSARNLRFRICFACSTRLFPGPLESRQAAMGAALNKQTMEKDNDFTEQKAPDL